MKGSRLAAAVLGAAVFCAMSASPGVADDDDGPSWLTESEENRLSVEGIDVYAPAFDDTSTSTTTTSQDAVGTAYESPDLDLRCVFDPAADEAVGDNDAECTPSEDAPSGVDIAAAVSTAFLTLDLDAPAITHQPATDWALVNMDFIVYTEPAPQTLASEIFGVPITIRATPVHYAWDFGDGGTLSTTDPGNPYPNHTVSHVYSDAADAVSVSMTTSWQGEFMVGDSGTWLPIAGMATTTSTAPPVEIVAMDVNLVPNS